MKEKIKNSRTNQNPSIKINTPSISETSSPFNTSTTRKMVVDMFKSEDKIDITPNIKTLDAFLYSGHNNHTAFNDLVDNPLDPDVNANNIRIEVIQSEGKYDYVRVADDGTGMNLSVLQEALKYGSNTGRNKLSYLGGYGCGLIVAALSMGRRFEIWTKSKDSLFYIAVYDHDEILKYMDFKSVPKRIGTAEEYDKFKQITGSETGTIVTVLRLDRMKNPDVNDFLKTLRCSLGKSFFYFLTEYKKHIFLDGIEVAPIDPIGRDISEIQSIKINESFEYEGYRFRFSIYNIPFISAGRSKQIGRGKPTAGLYIYRNNRLTGYALDLGIVGLKADGYGNGIRVELFMDGNCDDLFGTTYTKIIREQTKDEINMKFQSVCTEAIGVHTRNVINNEKQEAKRQKQAKKRITEIEIKKKIIHKNKYMRELSKAHKGKRKKLNLQIRVEESICDVYTKNPQGYSVDIERLIKMFTCAELSPPADNAGDVFVTSKSKKFNVAENRNIITILKKIIEIKATYCDSKTGQIVSIVRLKPTQKIDEYIIVLVDIIIPAGYDEPIDCVVHFYCLPAWYIEKSDDFTRDTVNGTVEANKNNQDVETMIKIKKSEALEKFGNYNKLRGTSFIDLIEYLHYLNNENDYLDE